ncbi:MAG: hypothetical protein WBB01_06530 [Phormidesmis sp.]
MTRVVQEQVPLSMRLGALLKRFSEQETTAQGTIAITFLVLNLERWLRQLWVRLFRLLLAFWGAVFCPFRGYITRLNAVDAPNSHAAGSRVLSGATARGIPFLRSLPAGFTIACSYR